MRAHGVPIPDAVPTFYPVPMELLTRARAIEVSTAESSGEIEPVLVIRDRDEWYLTLGSDHTARDIEKADIARSKAACPKIVCAEEWAYADVRPHWDRIELAGWAVIDGRRQPYQRGTLGDVMEPEELVRILRERLAPLPNGLTVCMGTLPLIGGKFVYAPRYEFEMVDPVLERRLALGYDVRVNAP